MIVMPTCADFTSVACRSTFCKLLVWNCNSNEGVINYFNTFNDNSFTNGAYNAFNCSFNPIDKLMQALDANKELYERLLASEREKVEILRGK